MNIQEAMKIIEQQRNGIRGRGEAKGDLIQNLRKKELERAILAALKTAEAMLAAGKTQKLSDPQKRTVVARTLKSLTR